MITLLSSLALSMFGKVGSFFSGNKTSILQYGTLLGFIAAAGLSIALWYKTTQQEIRVAKAESALSNEQVHTANLASRLNTVENINESLVATTSELQRQAKQDSDVIKTLVDDMKAGQITDSNFRKKFSELEKISETVKKYYDLPIPAELNCVLNDDCVPTAKPAATGNKDGDKNRSSGPTGGAGAKLPATTKTKDSRNP